METLKKIFPLAFKEKKDAAALVINIIIHIVAGFVAGLVLGFLGAIPIVGFVFDILGSVVGLYFTVSLVLSILDFAKVLK